MDAGMAGMGYRRLPQPSSKRSTASQVSFLKYHIVSCLQSFAEHCDFIQTTLSTLIPSALSSMTQALAMLKLFKCHQFLSLPTLAQAVASSVWNALPYCPCFSVSQPPSRASVPPPLGSPSAPLAKLPILFFITFP